MLFKQIDEIHDIHGIGNPFEYSDMDQLFADGALKMQSNGKSLYVSVSLCGIVNINYATYVCLVAVRAATRFSALVGLSNVYITLVDSEDCPFRAFQYQALKQEVTEEGRYMSDKLLGAIPHKVTGIHIKPLAKLIGDNSPLVHFYDKVFENESLQ